MGDCKTCAKSETRLRRDLPRFPTDLLYFLGVTMLRVQRVFQYWAIAQGLPKRVREDEVRTKGLCSGEKVRPPLCLMRNAALSRIYLLFVGKEQRKEQRGGSNWTSIKSWTLPVFSFFFFFTLLSSLNFSLYTRSNPNKFTFSNMSAIQINDTQITDAQINDAQSYPRIGYTLPGCTVAQSYPKIGYTLPGRTVAQSYPKIGYTLPGCVVA